MEMREATLLNGVDRRKRRSRLDHPGPSRRLQATDFVTSCRSKRNGKNNDLLVTIFSVRISLSWNFSAYLGTMTHCSEFLLFIIKQKGSNVKALLRGFKMLRTILCNFQAKWEMKIFDPPPYFACE